MKKLILFLFLGHSFLAWTCDLPIWLLTIPKTGTHCMTRIFRFITGRKMIGITHPSVEEAEKALLSKDKFLFSHCHYSKELADMVESIGAKVILLVRHPLDQLVSYARFVHKPGSVSWDKIKYLPLPQVISGLITSSIWRSKYIPDALDLKGYYELWLPWMDESFTHVVKYEDFIGGSDNDFELRKATIREMCAFLGVNISEEDLVQAAKEIDKTYLDATHTPGNKIGRWRRYLTEHDLEEFRRIDGDSLMNRLGYSY